MAWSKADLSAADIALAAANKPVILARNWLRQAGSFRGWDANGVSAFSDIAATGFDSKFAGDDYDAALTKPNAAANDQFFVFDFGSEGMTIDGFALLKHNLGTIGSVLTEVQIADDNAFSVRLVTIYSTTPTTNKRLVSLLLNDAVGAAQRYSNVRYLRVKFSKGSAITPQFGEMILSRRRQLPFKPDIDWDPNNLSSNAKDSDSLSGMLTGYVFHKGRRRIRAKLPQYTTTYVDEFEDFYETDTDFGTLPFLWIDDPAAAPTDASWMKLVTPELVGPMSNYNKRNFEIIALEHGPNFLKLGV